jgi:hypothetical protein
MDIALLEKVGRPYFLLETGDVLNFENLIYPLRENRRRYIAIMRGNKMRTWEGFMNEIAAALQFPSYFGENWSALDDCINDLDWLYCDAYTLVFTNSENILTQETEADRHTFGRILVRACEDWSLPADEGQWFARPGKPFHVVMHYSDMTTVNNFGNIYDGDCNV